MTDLKSSKTEGWTWLHNSRKWHYFRNNRSLCGGFGTLSHPSEGYEVGNDESKDNCASCRRAKLAEVANEQ